MAFSEKHIAIVVDDAEKILASSPLRQSLMGAASNGTVVTPDTSVNVRDMDIRPLRNALEELQMPLGLHFVLDEDPLDDTLYPKNTSGLCGHSGLLHCQREKYEMNGTDPLGIVSQALMELVLLALEHQLKIFQDIFRVNPAHFSYHNGWDFSIYAMEPLTRLAERTDIPVRVNRNSHTLREINLPVVTQETQIVIDSHNIPTQSPPTDLNGFVQRVSSSLDEYKSNKAEVVVHAHDGEVDHGFYLHHGGALAHPNIKNRFLEQNIHLVTPRTLISVSGQSPRENA